ncbi:MAG: MFS transporter [Rhodospirillales bacterium]|nr:MFS transporter [Rhodospirillales bacterium]
MDARSARLALAFSSVGHSFSHLVTLLYPTAVLALVDAFEMPYGELLSLSTAGFVLFGIGALPAGWLGDRWSAERMMVVFFVGTGLATVATGLATGPLGILLGLAAVGLFASIYHPVGIAWLVRNAERRGRALAWNGIFGSIGIGIAPILAGALTDAVSWRAAFIVPGVLCTIAGIFLALFVRSGTVVAATADRKPEPEAARADVIRVFVVLSLTMLGTGLVGQMVMVALPKVFEDGLPALTGGNVRDVGFWVSMVYAVSATVQLVGGWLVDRYPSKLVYALAWAAQVPLFWLAASATNMPLIAIMLLAQSAAVFSAPAENLLLARYTPGRWRATAYGAKFVLALGVSAAGVPLVGYIYDATGAFWWVFMVLAATAALVALAAMFLPSERRLMAPAPAPQPQPAE